MKKLLLVLALVMVVTIAANAQITPIRDIQYAADGGDSPLKGQVVTIQAVVTAEHRGDVKANGGISSSYFFVMDTSAAWSGIQVYYKGDYAAEGDLVEVTGTVDEYYGQTQIGNVTSFTKLSEGNEMPPVEVSVGEANSEAYEGCLVTIRNMTIVETGIGNYGEWRVSDGTDTIKVDTRARYYYTPVEGEPVAAITGIILYGYGQYSIAPRLAYDIVEGGDFTRIQRIQQVRNSDLLKAVDDQMSDVSYLANPENTSMAGDTVKIRGVVTMPTGLSYAGAGIKFILSEPEGGPWSSILSYNADSTAYPTLFEGDVVEMTGYIGEYRTGPSNMTEFWITSPIEIVDFGQPIPEPSFVKTGDLRLPVTAEQWGNVLVYVKDATVTNVTPQYELFAVDDGSGSVLVDDDSDSLTGYPDPPLGTIADSIRGWVYHHYGSYLDSTAYKLEPLYVSDIKWGAGPPSVADVMRDVEIPTAETDVTITANITTNLTIAEAAVYYKNASSTEYTKVVMTNTEGTTYQGVIPAQAAGSFISYYVMATDNQGQSTTAPPVIEDQNYCYPVTDGTLSIWDVQYNPWKIADTPFEGLKVEITGIATTDTTANNKYEAYAIQDQAAAWSGVFAFGIDAALNRGDEVTVYGTATDYNPDWGFKWDNNTVILVDSFKVLSSGNSVNPVGVTTGELSNENHAAEPWEGVLVEIRNATLTSVNRYDVTFDDGSGECLVDGDFMLARDQDPNTTFYINSTDGYLVAFGDTVHIGEKVDMIRGVLTFSFGSHKIEVRDANDFGTVTGMDENFHARPLAYKLEQNFPNPFNPETRLYFEIPETQSVKIVIYNILGQKVRTLLHEQFSAGHHVVNWDGRDDRGRVVPSGVYIYRMKAGDFIAAKKMMMMK